MIIKKYAYQRVRTRSERTERNLLALIEVVVDVALRGVLELAVVESPPRPRPPSPPSRPGTKNK
jgi:hypothetical protein